MIKRRKIGAFLCAVIVTLAVSGCDQSKNTASTRDTKKVSINMNLKKGDTYVVDANTDLNSTMKVQGQSVSSKQETDMKYDVIVNDVDKDNNATMEYKYESIKIKTESNGQTINYDSTNKDDSTSAAGQLYNGVIGKSFMVKVSNKGQILSVQGVDDLFNSVLDNMKLEGSQKEAVKQVLSKYFGDDAIKSTLQQSMNYYPDKNIGVGDTWNNKYNINFIFPLSIDSKYKLLSDENGKYDLDITSNVKSDSKEDIDILGVKAKVNLSGNLKGDMKLNKDNGFLSSGTLKETMKGNMSLAKSDKIPQEISVPMNITQTVKYNVVKK